MYLTQSLHRRAQGSPDEPMTVYRDRTTTAAQTIDLVARLAGGLLEHGVKRDDHVALLDLNTDHFAHASLAIAWADAVIVPVNYRWSIKEMAYSLVDAGVEVLVVGDAFLGLVDELRAATPELRAVVHLGDAPTPEGVVPGSALLASAPVPDSHRDGDQLLGIFYTGGTTGFPKGVMLTHRGVHVSSIGSAATINHPSGGACLLVAPAFHMAGFACWVGSMLQDQSGVMVSEFVPTEVMRLVQEHRVQESTIVPTMIQMIVDHPDIEQYDLSSFELVVYGASPISEALLDRARKALPSSRFSQAYGMTELSPVATLLRDEDHDHPVRRRSAGRPAQFSLVRIVDLDDNEVPRGTVGEITVKGDHVMRGYWNKPEETAAALRGGWMHTGDGGYMDDDGYVYVVDRIKDMIISGGENVYSIEVENAVAKHPSVAQVAVIGLADEHWGERVHAVVQLVPGATLTFEELREHTKGEIAGYKCPKTMEIVTEWPMSGAGKILKRELRAARA